MYNRILVTTLLAILILTGNTKVSAQEVNDTAPDTMEESTPSTRIGFGASITYPVSLNTGEGIPPTTSYTLKLLQPMNGWALVGTLGMNTTFGAFQPRPQISLGPSWRVGENGWAVGTGVLYRYLPQYENPSDDHFIATSLVVVKSFGDLSFSWLVGPGYRTEINAASVAVGFGIGALL